MENPKHPTLFSRYGQRRLGSELLDYLKAAEVAGDADASAELGSAYLDANGVEFDPERALHHFQKGARAGNKFCQFRIAEHQLKSGLKNNPICTSSHRQSYDIIWACAKAGVGEAFVTLHFLHAQFRQDPLGFTTCIRPEAEKSTALFLHALKTCYDYLDGGPADQCVTALEMLAREGFSPAYWTASIVAYDGCKDIARCRTNLVSAVKNGIAEAIEHFVKHPEDIDCPSTRFDLLTIAAGHGHAGAWHLLMSAKKARGLPEGHVASESLAFVRQSPRWFSHESLKLLEGFCSMVIEFQDEAPRVHRILASLGFHNSIYCLHSAKLVSGDNLLENYEHLEVSDQLELAKHIGVIFMAALNGSPEAWLLAVRAHANGTLAGHGPLGLSEGQHPAAAAVILMGTVYEKLSNKTILSDELRIPQAEQHASKEIAQIRRHVAHMKQMHTYGVGYMPSSRLLHDCSAHSGDASPTDYPWQISYPPITPSWPASPATRLVKVSRNPFVKKWIHPEGINDPLCHAMRHQLDNGNLSGAKQCLRFDKDLIPRLLTLAAGLYEAGHKLECTELLAFGIFHLKGQTGLAHHMLAWVYHELGRTSEAIRIAYDNLGFPELCDSSDSHHVELHLLLAEMLLLMNRSLEASEVLKKLRTLASNDSVILDRCEQLNRTDHLFSNLMWNINNKKGHSFVTVDRHDPDIKMLTLALTNMDRYRRIFPIKY